MQGATRHQTSSFISCLKNEWIEHLCINMTMFIKGIERTLTVNSYIPFKLKQKTKHIPHNMLR